MTAANVSGPSRMGKLIGLALAACCVMASAVWFAPRMMQQQAEAEAAKPVAVPLVAAAVGATPGDASISRSPDGHYWAQATVDGRAVRFLVDTGASQVALTQADARRLGLAPERLTYDVPVRTASGEARAAAVTLRSVSVSGARVDGVEALVVREGLETSLLGMTYLGRLSRFEATPRALILRR